MKYSTAKNVVRFVCDRILFSEGIPVSLLSNHAWELISRVLNRLVKVVGYVNTSMGGYCATGNSIIESSWSYFNTCVGKLNDERDMHTNVDEHLQHITWAWNTTVHATTGLRPFEICTCTSLSCVFYVILVFCPLGN